MVRVPRFELGTPSMSTKCSTTELYAQGPSERQRIAEPRPWLKPSFVLFWRAVAHQPFLDRAGNQTPVATEDLSRGVPAGSG